MTTPLVSVFCAIGRRNDQVRSMLADIADLESRGGTDFGLDGQVPLLIHRRLNLLIPDIDDRSLERIASDSATWALTASGLLEWCI